MCLMKKYGERRKMNANNSTNTLLCVCKPTDLINN